MTMSEVEVDRITQQVFAARNSGLDAALVKVVIDEIEAATTTEAMLATLVERGVLTERRSNLREPCGCRRDVGAWSSCCFGGFTGQTEQRRFVTNWEAAS